MRKDLEKKKHYVMFLSLHCLDGKRNFLYPLSRRKKRLAKSFKLVNLLLHLLTCPLYTRWMLLGTWWPRTIVRQILWTTPNIVCFLSFLMPQDSLIQTLVLLCSGERQETKFSMLNEERPLVSSVDFFFGLEKKAFTKSFNPALSRRETKFPISSKKKKDLRY